MSKTDLGRTIEALALMQEQTGRTPHGTSNDRGWQSDVIVDLIKRYGFPFITLNPGRNLILVTRNTRESECVPGLRIEDWQL